jgi:hypothetical protein
MASKAFVGLVVLLLLANGELGRATLISGRPPVSSPPHPSPSAGDPGQARSMNAMSGSSAPTTLPHTTGTGNDTQLMNMLLVACLFGCTNLVCLRSFRRGEIHLCP